MGGCGSFLRRREDNPLVDQNNIVSTQIFVSYQRPPNNNTTNTSGNNTNNNNDEIERLRRDLSEMEAFFQSLIGAYQINANFGDGMGGGDENAPPAAAPPVSRKALRQIPTVIVTPDDLVDETNRECCICFEENRKGDKVARLPCGHLYHRPCITSWLSKHCTCPICRYELETDNPTYEIGRKERMKHRKPRFRRYELDRMSLGDVRELCLRVGVSVDGVVEKRELVERVLGSGRVEVVASPKPVEHRLSELRGMGVGKLRRLMNEEGVFYDPVDVVEKEDMVQIFINSGRVLLVEEEIKEEQMVDNEGGGESQVQEMEMNDAMDDDSNDNNMNVDDERPNDSPMTDDKPANESLVSDDETTPTPESQSINQNAPPNNNNNPSTSPSSSSLPTPTTTYAAPPSVEYPSHHTPSSNFASRSVSQLKALARELGVDVSDCLEKKEMIERLTRSLR